MDKQELINLVATDLKKHGWTVWVVGPGSGKETKLSDIFAQKGKEKWAVNVEEAQEVKNETVSQT